MRTVAGRCARPRNALVALSVTGLALACAQVPSGIADSGSPSSVLLEAQRSSIVFWIGGSRSAPGDSQFVLIDLKVDAVGGETAIANAFSLTLDDGGIVDEFAYQLENGCQAIARLAQGASRTCRVAFVVPLTGTPTSLRHDPSGVTASVPALPATPLDFACAVEHRFNSPVYEAEGQECLQSCTAPSCGGEIDGFRAACRTCYTRCRSEDIDGLPAVDCGTACVDAYAALDACADPCLESCSTAPEP